MIKKVLAILGFLPLLGNGQEVRIKYVNPLIGSSNSTTIAARKHGEGTERLANTIPAVGVPFGMTQWTAQTQLSEQKCLAPYYYKDNFFRGFRGTHWLSGSCTQDYGSFSIMPKTGSRSYNPEKYAIPFSHNNEFSSPAYYRLSLNKEQITSEFTALARSSYFRFRKSKSDSLFLLISPNSDRAKAFIRIDSDKNEICGYNPVYRIYQGGGQPAGFSGYFVVRFRKDPVQTGVFAEGKLLALDSIKDRKGIGAFAAFYLRPNEVLEVKVGTSFTSIEDARRNLDAEIPAWDFSKVRRKSEQAWESALSKISIKTANKELKNVFYTAMYHSLQHPRLYNNVDGSYPRFAGNYQKEQLPGRNYYDDFSMWDIYRAQLPLFEMLNPSLIGDFVNSLILKGLQGGWLPIFPCWNSYTNAMIGDHSIAFIASAYARGIRNYDLELAYSLMRKNAFNFPSPTEYANGLGRRALQSYLTYNYVPLEDPVTEAFHKGEQVSRTLEFAYDDYALAVVAKGLNKNEDYVLLLQRAKNYRNVFDPSVKLMNGRFSNGTWFKPFQPDKKLPFITEGTPRQYTFYVPQDVPGLARLFGGRKELEDQLDSLFLKGEYWHGNEPGHQIPFMYNYTSSPWKTQREVHKILKEEYGPGPGGLSGNDDAGQMSAWYVFASIGLYPLDPVSGNYLLSSPLFDEIAISLPGRKEMKILCHRGNPEARYISAITVNGKPYSMNYISHELLSQGGRLDIYLSERPVNWSSEESAPPPGLIQSTP